MDYASIKAKVNLMGLKSKDIETVCGHKIILASKSKTEHTLYIPDDVTKIYEELSMESVTLLNFVEGKLTVIGGENLECLDDVFSWMECREINLTQLKTSKVTSMKSTFMGCKSKLIGIENLDVRRVTNMTGLFQYRKNMDKLDLSKWKTYSLETCMEMFKGCKLGEVDVTGWYTETLHNCCEMFDTAYIDKIDLSTWNFISGLHISSMFRKANILDLNLATPSIINIIDNSMLIDATIEKLTIYKEFEYILSITRCDVENVEFV